MGKSGIEFIYSLFTFLELTAYVPKDRSSREAAGHLTDWLNAWRAGDEAAGASFTEAVYSELRRLAAARLRSESANHTLRPTELVHEVFVRLAGSKISWQDRVHYFAVVAGTMRRVLVDHARSRASAKRGGKQIRVTLSGLADLQAEQKVDILDLDSALQDLSALDAVQSQLVELYYFAGLTLEESGAITGLSVPTAHRRLRSARAFLHDRLNGDSAARDLATGPS